MYDEIKAEIDRLKRERSNCKALNGAIGEINSELGDIKYSLNSSATTFGLGAFNIDGKAIDVYSFGGFKKYSSGKIEPLISALGGISSQITTLVIEYNNVINALQDKLDELDNKPEGKDVGIDKTKLKPATPVTPVKGKRSPRFLTQ